MRRVGFSASSLNDFVASDRQFMSKISRALQTIHDNYGAVAIEDCLQHNNKGDADIDLDVLAAMLDRTQAKLKNECCAMFFSSKSIVGSFLYLFGSLEFGAVTYFNETLSADIKTFLSVSATTFYLFGGILFIIAALEPYWQRTVEISQICKEVGELKKRGDIVRQMNRGANDNRIRARMSVLDIDPSKIFAPNAAEQQQILKRQKLGVVKEPDDEEDIFDILNEGGSPSRTKSIHEDIDNVELEL